MPIPGEGMLVGGRAFAWHVPEKQGVHGRWQSALDPAVCVYEPTEPVDALQESVRKLQRTWRVAIAHGSQLEIAAFTDETKAFEFAARHVQPVIPAA